MPLVKLKEIAAFSGHLQRKLHPSNECIMKAVYAY